MIERIGPALSTLSPRGRRQGEGDSQDVASAECRRRKPNGSAKIHAPPSDVAVGTLPRSHAVCSPSPCPRPPGERVSSRFARCVIAAAVLLVALLGGCEPPPAPQAPEKDAAAPAVGKAKHEIRVAAAADLRFALEDAIQAFEKANPDTHVTATFGSSGNFFQQLSNKAPFDLFLSADIGYPEKLIEQELALSDSLFEYATGKIVVWARKDSTLKVEQDGMEALRDPAAKKIAIANPKFAPYGRAAEAALKSLKLYDEVEPRLVLGENIAQTAQFVESGSADVGIIALSIAVAPTMRDQGQYALVPADSYPPIRQGGVVLSWVQDREATLKFRDFLESAEGRAVLDHFGFSSAGK